MIAWVNNTLCVKGGWLCGEDGIMTKSCYDHLVQREDIDIIQRACRNRPAWVAYESMPERFKSAIESKIGDVYEYVKENELLKHIQEDQKALKVFRDHRFGDDRKLPDEAILEYYSNVKVINAVRDLINIRRQMRRKLGKKSMANVWEDVAKSVGRIDKRTIPHSLPLHPRRLQEKLSDYLKEGPETFIHGGFCNKNKEKLNDEVKLWVLAQWANNIDRITSEAHLLQAYNDHAREMRKQSREAEKTWKEIKSEATLHNFLYSDGIQMLWWGARYGELKAKEKFVYQHSTLLPTMRDGLWYSDGTKLNYYYQDEEGNIATTSVYEVMDVYSEVMIGYAFCKTENYQAQRAAFKKALQTSGQKPYQVSFDGQGGHKKMEAISFFDKMARLAIKTEPYNGKSKTIESAFGRFQKQFLKKDWFFTGQNITAKDKESRENMEYILANKENLPTLEEVKARYLQRREEWNNAAHPKTGRSRMEMYRESVNPGAVALSVEDMRDLFCVEHEEKVRVTAYGVSFELNTQKYTYMIYDGETPDVDWIADHVDRRYIGKYDPDDMKELHLYEDTKSRGLRYVATAEIKFGVHRGKQEQEDWEAAYFKKVESKKKALRVRKRDEIEEILRQHNLLPEQHGLNSPALKGIETSRSAKKTEVVKERKKRKQRTKGIAEVQKEISNVVMAGGGDDEVDAILDGYNKRYPLEGKKKNIYNIM